MDTDEQGFRKVGTMRLICPNCDAEYEVDALAIPEGGRDVQCSACGHGWYQMPSEPAAAQEDMAPPMDALGVEDAEVPPPPAVEPAATRVATQARPRPETAIPDEADAAEPEDAPPLSRGLDESLLAVLREEAERETAARRAEAFETQSEMTLEPQPQPQPQSPPQLPAVQAQGPAVAALKKLARLRGEPEPKSADQARARKDLLPEIDEINSSLRAAGEARAIDQGAVAETLDQEGPQKSGFGAGFLTVVLLVILGAAIYVLAPVIAARVPALDGALQTYVHAIDTARIVLNALAKALTAKLIDLIGGAA